MGWGPDEVIVPFLDLAAIHSNILRDITGAISHVLDTNRFVLGPQVSAFEEEWAEYTDADFCVAVNSGLDAITLALRACGIGPQDEVLVPSHTFIATWLAVSEVGAIPVPVEPRPGEVDVNPDDFVAHIRPSTRAVVAVFLYGRASDLGSLRSMCQERGVALIVDAAQAHGARISGRGIGAVADATAWSFYPGKNLGALGDGGAITTNSRTVAEAAFRLHNYGSTTKYQHQQRGVNSRLDEIQAAVLRVKLKHLDEWNDVRSEAAIAYSAVLPPEIGIPSMPQDRGSMVWHLFVVRHPSRDSIVSALTSAGIETGVHYPTACHRQGAYKGSFEGRSEDFPVAEGLAKCVLSLPMGPHMNQEKVNMTAEAIHLALGNAEV